MTIAIGMNGRFFPANWRPAAEEIAFCAEYGFNAIQFRGHEEGLQGQHLGDALSEIGALLQQTNVVPVMEILLDIDLNGMTETNKTPLQVLHANLDAIRSLGCIAVHWHVVLQDKGISAESVHELEQSLYPQLTQAVSLSRDYGFRFGIEHNEPEEKLFSTPQSCAAALEIIPHLGFVWDINHTAPQQLEQYTSLASRLSMLHVSDTMLPDTNYHLPLGLGNINFEAFVHSLLNADFHGIAILEIGGLPKSGGFGRDTDEALINSRNLLANIISRVRQN